jgi:lipopolysaccharide biosynthesis protein
MIMLKTAAIYVIPFGLESPDYISYAVRHLRGMVDHLIIVTSPDQMNETDALLDEHKPDQILSFGKGPRTPAAGYKVGLAKLWDKAGTVILTGSHVAGPLTQVDPRAFALARNGAHMFCPYWHNAKLDPRLKSITRLDVIPYLDFAVISETLMLSEDFRKFWREFIPSANFWEEFLNTSLKLAEILASSNFNIIYPAGSEKFETADPRLFEVHKIVEMGFPCFPLAVFLLDPVIHDLNSIDMRIALDRLRASNNELYQAIIQYVTRNISMRDFNTIADQYEIFSEKSESVDKKNWSFGKIAVFIHAFYADMMPEFWELLQRIPCDFDLFITTSTSENKTLIESFLSDRGFEMSRAMVVIVEKNRGRDMSSLFISFRDVALSGGYEVALRLHSKRTPQVSRQVGESFKKHLFDNLIKSPGYVSNILDRLEAEPDIGMIIPPIIHIGFATLGHSWFNNRRNLMELATDMGVKVPFDNNTPVAAYGTMYWFRTDALRRMFEWKWRWDDYNPEPNHIDGGLAHVQERLIGYCVQDRNYRILSAMTPELAARNYAKLEYKLQLLASHLVSGNILHQRDQLDHLSLNVRRRAFQVLEGSYGAFIRRFPFTHRVLRPTANMVSRLIRGQNKR